MNLIAKLLPPSNILLDLDVTSKKRVFEQAGLLFENNQGVARSLVFDSLFARERLGSTEQATEQHLRILSELAQMLSDRELRGKLSTDTDAGTLHQHITAWQPHVADQRRAAV